MTLNQYFDLIRAIAHKQSFDIQTNTVAMTGDFDDEVNPFYSIKELDNQEPQKMTVEQAQELSSLLGS